MSADGSFNFPENSSELQAQSDRASARQTPIDLDFLFSKDAHETLEFEIVFITLVTTAVLSVPNTDTLLDPIAVVAVFTLILLTVIRRMAVGNSWVDTKRIYTKTFDWVWFISIFSISYSVLSINQWLISRVFDGEMLHVTYLVWGTTLVIMSILVVVAYELNFRDFVLWAAVLFYNRSIENNAFAGFWLLFSNVMLNESASEMNENHYAIMKIRHRYQGTQNEGLEIVGGRGLVGFLSFVILFIGVIFSYPYSAFFGSPLLTISIVMTTGVSATLATTAILSFFYQRYGTTSYEQTPIWTRGFAIVYGILVIHTISKAGWSVSQVQPIPPLF